MRYRTTLLFGALLAGTPCFAQQPTVELSQTVINRVIASIGTLSDAGVAQPHSVAQNSPLFEICTPLGRIACPGLGNPPPGFPNNEIPFVACRTHGGGYAIVPTGEPVTWEWRITNAYVTLAANSMRFTASVVARVGGDWSHETRTVNAILRFDASSNRLKLEISPFTVSLRVPDSSTTLGESVDVARLYAIALELQPQPFSVPLPNGTSRNINARVTGATASYSVGLARVTLNVSP